MTGSGKNIQLPKYSRGDASRFPSSPLGEDTQTYFPFHPHGIIAPSSLTGSTRISIFHVSGCIVWMSWRTPLGMSEWTGLDSIFPFLLRDSFDLVYSSPVYHTTLSLPSWDENETWIWSRLTATLTRERERERDGRPSTLWGKGSSM